jgi:hypothetical protein
MIITQTAIHNRKRYKPLYLCDDKKMTWSGDINHAKEFSATGTDIEGTDIISRIRRIASDNLDYEYALTKKRKDDKMIEIIVGVKDSHKGSMGQVAKALEQKGFVLDKTLDTLGVLTGKAPEDILTDLSSVDGVLSVEKEQTSWIL